MKTVQMKFSNRVVTVPESRMDSYLKRGYDHIDLDGTILTRATGGKVVNIAEHNALLDELEVLKAGAGSEELEALNDAYEKLEAEHATLKKENATLKGENTKLKKELEK